MGIRETLNENPRITTGVTIGIVVIALGLIVWQLMPQSAPAQPTKAWFTEDDGATLFADDLYKPAPFTGPGGKEAVRAHVFKCEGEAQEVVYLEKFTPKTYPKAQEAYEASKNAKGNPQMEPIVTEVDLLERLLKKPGEAKWTSTLRDSEVSRIQTIKKCPDGRWARSVLPDSE